MSGCHRRGDGSDARQARGGCGRLASEPAATRPGAFHLFMRLRRQMSIGSRALFCLWLLVMILTPHALRLGGQAALLLILTLSTLVQVGLVLSLLGSAWTGPATLRAAAVVVVLAWLSEFIGVRTGLPFGGYVYTDALQPQIGRVPVQVPAAWLMMLPPAWAAGEIVTGRRRVHRANSWRATAAFSLASGLAITAWDLFLDPQMVAWNLWRWEPPGPYFGIPPLNFAGWTLTATGITFALFTFTETEALPVESLLLVYTTSWLLESVGLGLFFQLPGAAAVGFVGMGLFVLLAWRKMFTRLP